MWWRKKEKKNREPKIISFDETNDLLKEMIRFLRKPDPHKRIRKIRKIFDTGK
mgnify:CR=1 FL=1|jgi:hypothetical protein